MQQSLGLIFKNTLLTGGGGVRGFLGQRGQLTPFVDGLVRGSNVSTFSGGGPTNVLDSRVYHHGGAFSGHLRFGGMQLSSSFVALRGIYCGGGLSFSTFAGRGSSNVLDPHVYHQAVSFNNYIRSSTWTLSRYYSSNVPLPSRHLEVNGKDCTVTCDDDQYQVLCELLSIPFGSGIPEMKVYSHPDQFIREAEKYERVGDYIQSSKKSWGAYVLTIKSLYKNLQINIHSHDTLHKLSLFAIGLDDDVPNKESLGFTVRLMNGSHQNWYKGRKTRKHIQDYIKSVKKFAELFGKINEKRVWNRLAPYLPTQPGPEHAIIFNGVKFEMRKHSDAIFGKWFNFLYEASDPENEE